MDWDTQLFIGDSFIIKYRYVVVGISKATLFVEKSLKFHNLKVNETPFQRKKSLSLEISREIKNDEKNKENRVIFQKRSKSQGDSSLKKSFFERFKNMMIFIGNP